jgi:hypothetical protein
MEAVLTTDSLSPNIMAACWLDTELANTDKERSVVVAKGGAIIVYQFQIKASSK